MFKYNQLSSKIPGSKYFIWREALWINSVQAVVQPTWEQQENIIKQAIELDKVREYFGAAITVTSWLRPDRYNKMIGGAKKSWHIKGLATDFTVEGHSVEAVKASLQHNSDCYGGRGELDTTNWIHLDLGGTDWFYAKAPGRRKD